MTVPFVSRHIGPNDSERAAMLKLLGAPSLDAFIEKAVPAKLRSKRELEMEPGLSEAEALAKLKAMADQNQLFTSAIGMGYYGTHTPPVILRNVLENPGWYTAYTPYQAEVSQGRLEALLNFQQMVMDLTGLDIANASLLDEATAAAEAMAMAKRSAKSQANVFFIDKDTHPQTIGVLQTRAKGFGFELVIDDVTKLDASKVFGALLSYPGSSGAVRDHSGVIAKLHETGALAIMATDLMALTLLKTPGELGADIALGSAQRFGVPMGFGGPHAAFFAVKDELKRVMPGRLIGVSVDAAGNRALRMALQTREQHIRRDKATSNICTAQVLLAVMAGFYACWHGPEGLKAMAEDIHGKARKLAGAVKAAGHTVISESFFDTLTIKVKGGSKAIHAAAKKARINLRQVDAQHVGVALDETTSDETLHTLIQIFGSKNKASATGGIPLNLKRHSAYLTHPVFHRYRTETEMMRYMRLLQGKDLALDQAMIPLGSCTMKLNAAAEMIPVTWPEIGQIHPFAPASQTKGYASLFQSLEKMLCEITGFDAVSLQPNAGSQGEYAGLMAIRGYHDDNGGKNRDVCLIPVSAHGTNPASAAMCGMKIVVVACDAKGNVDVADLEAKAKLHADNLAALMITYPSTHGVYEDSIVDICAIIHRHKGLVYLDGANLNAQVGLMRPAELGADVCHMNLHKTFCIPHGGGGPGMGPIGVRKFLAPYLPGHPVVKLPSGSRGEVSAAPYGSASILVISWMYIAMMGGDGLTEATKMAILNANYMAARLKDSFPILYSGPQGTVAHECILDLRWLKEKGLSVEDVAKRLADYGFHAPTMSFPVVDTLMVEPTESEAKGELDRFCDAMIAIRKEIDDVISGKTDKLDNVLKNAPHTHKDLMGEWTHPYQKAQAFFPLGDHGFKYWPPVKRVDNVYGDRNLICACPPMEDYLQAAE